MLHMLNDLKCATDMRTSCLSLVLEDVANSCTNINTHRITGALDNNKIDTHRQNSTSK
jgi:hypothetical protein